MLICIFVSNKVYIHLGVCAVYLLFMQIRSIVMFFFQTERRECPAVGLSCGACVSSGWPIRGAPLCERAAGGRCEAGLDKAIASPRPISVEGPLL